MFEVAEVGRTVAKQEYVAEVAKLRWELLDAQRMLSEARVPLIALFGGVDGGGKTESVQLLNEWMDPSGIVNRAFDDLKKQILEQQGRLNRLQQQAQVKGRSTVLVFEGWDAAGVPAADRPRRHRDPFREEQMKSTSREWRG